MNFIKDKTYKQYDYTSRYQSFPLYYHTEDDAYFYGLTGKINKDVSYVKHTIKQADTLDSLSLNYYGRPDFYWVIADYNDITDPFTKLFGRYDYLLIPSLANITFGA